MSRIASSRLLALLIAAGALLGAPLPAWAQAPRVVSSEVEISRQEAALRFELETGDGIALAIRNGRALVGDRDIGGAPRGGELDRAWRALLTDALDTPSDELGALLAAWTPPATESGRRFEAELQRALLADQAAQADAAADAAQAVPADALSDSVVRLRERIQQLERTITQLERADAPAAARRAPPARADRNDWFRPFRHIWRGIAGIISLLVTYGVLFAIAVVAIFFGARRYIEAVADTARQATLRSAMVGLAGTFLAIPVFVLGIIALAISIVGIPALLVWVPLFPVAVVLAALLGYLAVAHAAGESLGERRYSAETWFQRGNSYYFILTGLLLLMAFFLAGHIVQMAGPWLGFIRGLLFFIGGVITWAALTIGFGAVLISRAGTRPLGRASIDTEPDLFTETAHV